MTAAYINLHLLRSRDMVCYLFCPWNLQKPCCLVLVEFCARWHVVPVLQTGLRKCTEWVKHEIAHEGQMGINIMMVCQNNKSHNKSEHEELSKWVCPGRLQV